MSRIKSGDTAPERAIRGLLHSLGFRFRNSSGLRIFGKPDIVLPKYRTLIFVHGCFWHRHRRCRYCYTPKSRIAFWQRKFDSNVKRDAIVRRRLRREGWRIITIWECEIGNIPRLSRKLAEIKKWARRGA